MRWFKDQYLTPFKNKEISILDVGSYDVNGTYKPILSEPSWTYTGADLEKGPNVDIVLKNPYQWRAISSNAFDIVVSGQAFEHVEWFWLTILEMQRVLKPGGLCCILAPAGGYEHKFPVDCWRFYPDGLSAMATFADMEVLHVSTQWESLNYDDGSDQWKDSMLVCRKKLDTSVVRRLRSFVRSRLLGFALTF
jgi:SAM-dependent methyltransferase